MLQLDHGAIRVFIDMRAVLEEGRASSAEATKLR
jgi:hypothetical protein